MKRLALVTLAALAAATGHATAHEGSRYGYNNGSEYRAEQIDRRRNHQYRKIFRANSAGEITYRERERLFAEQNRISRMEPTALRNGYMSRSEARKIGRAQNDANRHIRNESTDGQYRY